MPYLEPLLGVLGEANAAHLLRRATFGPSQREITHFATLTASQAVQQLVDNKSYYLTSPGGSQAGPVVLENLGANYPGIGQPFNDGHYYGLNPSFVGYIRHWWTNLMIEQKFNNGVPVPSLLDKLTLFWQNHFVTVASAVDESRYIWRYLNLLRNNALGNFRTLVTEIAKDPAMLVFLNGNENVAGQPNENFARELQELFTVGAKDFLGQSNYTEDDVKAAAKVLTGWRNTHYNEIGSTTFGSEFVSSRHDPTTKVFSSNYGNHTIPPSTGDTELADLVNMLLMHPQTPKFICRKLYRWYVNTDITDDIDIETNVITVLANDFVTNGFNIEPIVKKILASQIFFDSQNRGAIIKSPAEFFIGALRTFNLSVPSVTTNVNGYHTLGFEMWLGLKSLGLEFFEQPSVFGYPPYYQAGYSENWITYASLYNRKDIATKMAQWNISSYKIDILPLLNAKQTEIGGNSISCDQALDAISKNLFVFPLTADQRDYVIDKVMVVSLTYGRQGWVTLWSTYRNDMTNTANRDAALTPCRVLLTYLFNMAEYQIF